MGKQEKDKPKVYGKIQAEVSRGVVDSIDILDFVEGMFCDGRKISVLGTSDDNISIFIQNPEESGRNPMQRLHLTKQTFSALLHSMMIYVDAKELDLREYLLKGLDGAIKFNLSDNLEKPTGKHLAKYAK